MKRIALALALWPWLLPAQAQTFADQFESTIAPQFPLVGGQFQLPPSPTTTQWQWLQGELQAGQTTTAAEVNAHFDPAWLATNRREARMRRSDSWIRVSCRAIRTVNTPGRAASGST